MTKEFRYFTLNEFEKSSSGKVPSQYLENAYEILGIADELRHHYGKPLKILQGGAYRDESFNRKCGGKPSSRHLIAQAIDLRPVNNCNEQEIKLLKDLLEKLLMEKLLPTSSLLGINVYLRDTASFIHVDARKGVKYRGIED